MTLSLGTLTQIDIRVAWLSEPGDFTPWLASEAGIRLLGETLGVELEVVSMEEAVGPFKADIVARRTDTPDESLVLIENQLERTDHLHLGQLLTYAAGLKAATIVWVARNFTEQHRAALDWLNEITSEHFEFYGVEIELWKIGESDAAPKFNLVARPNDWSREVRSKAVDSDVSPLKQLQQQYWGGLRERLVELKGPVKSQMPLPQHWTNFSIGRTGVWLQATVTSRGKWISASLEVQGPPGKGWYFALLNQRDAIEAEIGQPLEWEELPNRKVSRAALYRRNCDFQNEAEWAAQHAWLADALNRLHKVFRNRVRALNGTAGPNDDSEAAEPAG